MASDALEKVCHTPHTAPLDSGLRRNDEMTGMTLLGGRLGLRCTGKGLPHPSPPLWIPAFAGMTKVGGRRFLGGWVGLRCTEEGLPRPSPPLWIPAFAFGAE